MTKLQSVVKHDSDCSCFKIKIVEYGSDYDGHTLSPACNICDCGALRSAVRTFLSPIDPDARKGQILWDCWLDHLAAIDRSPYGSFH